MKVMVMVKATPSSETGKLPSQQLLHDMHAFNEELVKAGIMEAGEGLKPSSAGYRVRFDGRQRHVIDGPFAETNELVAGFWVWNVDSVEQALEWVKKCPNPMEEVSDIEIRPMYGVEDFAPIDPEGVVADKEIVLREKIADRARFVQSYLFFGGKCEEAIDFYVGALNAKPGMRIRFDQSPEPAPEGMLAPGFETKIMHAEFTVGSTKILCSDGCGENADFRGFRLALSLPTKEEVTAAFNGLADGGKVDMPLTPTFWSPLYGMVTDKFGVEWMVMVPGAPM